MNRNPGLISTTFGAAALACVIWVLAPSPALAGTSDELQGAKERGQVAFVLVTEPGAQGVREAERIIRDAVKKHRKAVLIRLDRSEQGNASLVSRFRLTGPQIPLVLVFAPNGVIAGGAPTEGMTVDGLLGMVPSTRESELIGILQSGKGVAILATREGMSGIEGALAACEKAREMAGGKLEIVRVDMGDKSEQAFLGKLRVNTGSTGPVTVVISSRGQVTGAYDGVPEPGALVQACNKVAGGCCPGGAKKGAVCAPK